MGFEIGILFALVVSQITPEIVRPPAFAFDLKGSDISAEYHREWSALSDARTETLVTELQNYKVLMIPGFFSNNVIALGGEQFEDQMHWFTNHGVENERVWIESEADNEFNAIIIREKIIESKKPVIIIAQSKGCMDSLASLVAYPEIREKVKAFLPLNGPFQGTPLANLAVSYSHMRDTISWMLEQLGGDIRSVESLRVEVSQRYLDREEIEIQNLRDSMPLIALAARIPRDPKRMNTSFAIPRDFLEAQGYINDGLLPWQSSVLPGAEYVLLENFDHATSIRNSKKIPFDRVHFIQTMLWMLRKRTPDAHF